MSTNTTFSQGLAYLPPAFEGQPYVLGHLVADNYYFNQTFVRYIWAIVSDFNQLLDFRLQLINDAKRILEGLRSLSSSQVSHNIEYQKSDEIPILWCALSLVSDRYFTDVAASYAWDEVSEEHIISRWYSLIAPIFIPSAASRKLRAKDIQAWTSEFLTFHKVTEGPLPACHVCETKCFYGYDVANLIDEQMHAQVENNMDRADPVDAIAILSKTISETFFGKQNIDASLCFVVHWLKDRSTSLDNSLLFIEDIRTRLEELYSLPISKQKSKESAKSKKSSTDAPTSYSNSVRQQIFESIIDQAMTDNAWKYACAAVMQIHDISVPEVERELIRRKQE